MVDWGAGGLVAERLGSAAEADGAYLGGIVPGPLNTLLHMLGLKARIDDQVWTGSSREDTETIAMCCRKRFSADYGLAISRTPHFDPATPQPKPFFIALATAGGVRVE